jgi:hypothetical protein
MTIDHEVCSNSNKAKSSSYVCCNSRKLKAGSYVCECNVDCFCWETYTLIADQDQEFHLSLPEVNDCLKLRACMLVEDDLIMQCLCRSIPNYSWDFPGLNLNALQHTLRIR